MSRDADTLEAPLAETEDRYRSLFDELPLPAFVYDVETLRYLAVNQVAIELYGYTREEFLAMTISDIRPPEDVGRLLAVLDTLDRRPRHLGVWRHLRKDGGLLEVDIVSRLTSEKGRAARFVLAKDVTEQRKAERALAEAKAELSSAQSLARVGSWEWNPRTGQVRWSAEILRMLGLAGETTQSFEGWLPLVHPEDKSKVLSALEGALHGERFDIEMRFTLPSGELVAHTLGEMRERGGERVLFGTLQDITERRRLELAVKESDENFRVAFRTVPDAMSIVRLSDGVNVAVNEIYTRLSGWSEREAIGKTSLELDIWVYPEQRAAVMAALKKDGVARDHEVTFRRKDGTLLEATVAAGVYSVGRKDYFLTVSRDITDRKRSERVQNAIYRIAEAAGSSGTLRQMLGAVHRIVSELMPAPNFYIALYDAAAGMLDFPYYVDERGDIPSGPEPLGKGITEYVLRTGQPLLLSSRAQFEEMLRQRGDLEQVGERALSWVGVPLRTQDRTVGVLAAQIYEGPLRYSQRDADLLTFVSTQVARAIERKQGEEALRESEQGFRALIGNSTDGILVMTPEGDTLFSSASVVRILGEGADAAGVSILSRVHPEDKARVDQIWSQVLASPGVPIRAVARMRHQNGSWRELESVVVNRLEDPAVQGIVSNFRDVTDRRQMEARLMMADRMVSVGTLAAGVAHEINNPLAYVLANLEYVSSRLASDDRDVREALQEAQAGAERVRTIVRDLKTFSRGDEVKNGPVDLHRVLDASANMAWNEIRHRARLAKDYSGTLPLVIGNESRLGQVFLNLLINAAQAIPEGDADRNLIRISARVEGGQVVVDVRDSGNGIPAEHLSRLFDPFFTTKPVGVGTGLGLFICQNIVGALGGEISVDSEPGKGTTVHVALQVAACAEEPAQPPAPAPREKRGRVLIIDDEPLIGTALARRLPGHEVVVQTSALAALSSLRGGERFDLILCDVMMPDMTGVAFFEALEHENAAAARQVVFMTGGAFTPTTRAFLERVPNPRLEKPLEIHNLRAILADRLQGSPR